MAPAVPSGGSCSRSDQCLDGSPAGRNTCLATLGGVVNHYDQLGDLALSPTDKTDLVEYLKSL